MPRVVDVRVGVAAVLAVLALVGCVARYADEQQEAVERLAQRLASELPELMDSDPTTPTYRQLSDLPSVDGIEHVAVNDVGTVASRAPDADRDALGVDLAVSVKFPGRDTYVCVVLAATSTGASDAAVAPAVPLDECENPPGRLGRGDFASACDLLRRDAPDLRC